MQHKALGRIISAVSVVCALSGAALATLPDLDVTFIERTPRYNYDATKNNPEPGDVVTFHGHIRNWGTATVSSVAYRWKLDGSLIASDTLTNFAGGDEQVVTCTWTWEDGNHEIELVVDPGNAISESSESNNAISDRTNSIIAGFWVEQSVYDYFQQNQQALGIGSNSWEDWIQRQMERWNFLAARANWTDTPSGVLDRVRIDKIVVVSDGALPLSWGLPTNHPNANDKTVDLMWGFPATLLDGTFYSNHSTVSDSNPFYIEQSLIHELGHARYLIDCYGFDVHNTSSHHSVQIYEGDTYVAGSDYMPFVAFGEVLYYNKSGGVMSGPYGFVYSPYETMALNRIAGQRACCGNYNSPGNIGVFLQDLPESNHMQILDSLGQPRAGAEVEVYQATGWNGGWYGKTFDDTPDLFFTADSEGYIHMPRNPFSATTIQQNYGIANGTAILRIEHDDQVWYRFIEVTDFNIEYWRGHTQDGYYTLDVEGEDLILGDIDVDGDVDLADLANLLAAYGTYEGEPRFDSRADLDLNGVVDLSDLVILLANYGFGR